MAGTSGSTPATLFGKHMKKEREAHGWSLREMSARTGIDAPHLSRIETGRRPPTERVALACDAAFPERRGYFIELYREMLTWMPPGFRDWGEYEDAASSLRAWSPGVLHGLVQTERYARSMLATSLGVTDEVIATRLRSRMERQKRVLYREDPPEAWFIVDQLSLYREVGSPEIMSEQMRHLASVARLPNVKVQVMPAVAHPVTQSGFLIADSAGYAEHCVGGFVYDDAQTVTNMGKLFVSLQVESYRASESLALIEEVGEIWQTHGVRAASQELTGETA